MNELGHAADIERRLARSLTADELEQHIFGAVSSSRPSSFIRFNDGEARIVGREMYFPPESISQQLRRFFGDNLLTGSDLVRLGNSVSEAVRDADVIGIPPVDWPIEFSCAREIVGDICQENESVWFTHVDFHQSLFNSNFFRTLFGISQNIGLITCRDASEFLRDNYGANTLEIYEVPEQADGSLKGTIDRHYPDHCNWLSRVISAEAQGRVFLVGAGICGKIYCDIIKKSGGIAIDVGSIFDLWVGRFSRPYMETSDIRSYYINRLKNGDISPGVIRANTEILVQERKKKETLDLMHLGQDYFPYSNEFYIREVSFLLEMKLNEEAIKIIESIYDHILPDELIVFARLLKLHGEIKSAASYLSKIITKHPYFVPAVIELCGLFVDNKSIISEDMILRLVSACEVNLQHGNPDLLFQYSRLLGSTGDIPRAITLTEKAIMMYPFSIQYISHVMNWLKEDKRFGEAFLYQKKYDSFIKPFK